MELNALFWISAGLILLILVLRFLFKLAGWILKLVVVAALGLTIWWLFTGM
ncbi:MAG: hypothetical protein ACRENP_13805 [Longimicrobiales bacterium]